MNSERVNSARAESCDRDGALVDSPHFAHRAPRLLLSSFTIVFPPIGGSCPMVSVTINSNPKLEPLLTRRRAVASERGEQDA